MHNSQAKLALDENIAREQQIKMFGHRSGERIFDGNYRDGGIVRFDAVKYFRRTGARNNRATGQHPSCGFVAEGPELSLNGNFHLSNLAGGNRGMQIFFEQERIDMVRIVTRNGLDDVESAALVEGQS